MELDKKTVENLARLVRIRLGSKEDDLITDFKEIVSYFDEFKSLDVSGVKPMNGGTLQENIFRSDEYDEDNQIKKDVAVSSFPEEKDGFLEIPPVFLDEDKS